ncbi:uncharacterized protein LOC113509291 [Galleria mellonella]|uniref:Uncharacterized protein LOC113509291 n=1 Tax=Galleria mellonella TaxID=7137 RepID=A0ABM3MLD4_GALME|nr:uncharacterized protein LOC113509291 [Galleria mellonella]
MECNESNNKSSEDIDESNAALNPVILNYYKKFGKKRDLEQYFSLSTAQTEIRDPTSLFWRKMKSQDSSDSGEKRGTGESESSTELCRISIKCSVPEACGSQDKTPKTKSDSESPPIIMEDVASKHSDNDSVKSDDYHSQKSMDAIMDTSLNKPLSPSSSITSQRKLEWDSLADVGYANESDRKTSASSLSTLERLALKQQYSNNDKKQDSELEPPTAHSTPLEQGEGKIKGKRGIAKKTTTIYKKDIDYVEVNVPHKTDTSPSRAINVNLTKHISFNVEKDGGVTLENIKKDINITPEKVSVETEVTPQVKIDKEIQTSLNKNGETNSQEALNKKIFNVHRIPLVINLNTLKKRNKRKKLRTVRRKRITKNKTHLDKGSIPVQERNAEQVSEAESFEYMPGHIYNQKQLKQNESKLTSMSGNKSSLESSGVLTTDSSKASMHSFGKDLKKSIDVLKMALQHRQDDPNLKKRLIKEIVQRLLTSKYRDDDSTTEFLSGLSISSKKIEREESNTTSTSDGNTTGDKTKLLKPKKSILRLDKFNPSGLASTSQSAPNLSAVSTCEKPVISKFVSKVLTSSYTESDASSKEKTSSDTAFAKTSSEELYKKYLDALKREESYRRHLRDKEYFLKQKLVSSDNAFKIPYQPDLKSNNKLKELMKDLTRNNYDDGSGDANNLEGGSNTNVTGFERHNIRQQRSHSVFTLSSGTSDAQNKKTNLKKRLQSEINENKITQDKNDEKHYCRRHKPISVGVTDSSVQVDIKLGDHESSGKNYKKEIVQKENENSSRVFSTNVAQLVPENETGDIKYVCLCTNKGVTSCNEPDGLLIYKCSRLTHTGTQLEEPSISNVRCQCKKNSSENNNIFISQPSTSRSGSTNDNKEQKLFKSSSFENVPELRRTSQSSQTNIALNMLRLGIADKNSTASCTASDNRMKSLNKDSGATVNNNNVIVYESTRLVQTEISINPKISDPSLTDIFIINDVDCVEIIKENLKKAAKRNSEVVINQVKHGEVETDTNSDKSVKIVSLLRKSPSESNTNFEKVNKLNDNAAVDTPGEKFTIPIQGTNMTLKVTIDSNVNKSTVEKYINERPEQGTDVIQVDVVEKATCLMEECTKGVQSQTTNIFMNMNNEIEEPFQKSQSIIDYNSNRVNKQEILNTLKKSCVISSCNAEGLKYNTYPKNIPVNKHKPFLRSNTDTGRFDTACGVQTDDVVKVDAVTQGYSKSDTEKTRESDTDQSQSGKLKSNSEQSSKQSNCRTPSEEPQDNEFVPGLRLGSRKSSSEASKDPILDMIQDITRRYSKKDIDKGKRKKCFKEIITVLNYLLDTDDSTNDYEQIKMSDTLTPPDNSGGLPCSSPDEYGHRNKNKRDKVITEIDDNKYTKMLIDKGVQFSARKTKGVVTPESSELPFSTDLPSTSSDAATCKVLNKIQKECDKYHQKRCKAKKCEVSSSTSVNCEKCKRVHHCSCRGHKCRTHKTRMGMEKIKKKCVAYNLIIQTSDSMVSEDVADKCHKSLQNIIVKVPPKHKQTENVPFKELSTKIGKDLPHYNPSCSPKVRSRSLPNECEVSSTDEIGQMGQRYTVRDYLEKNRPDFVENCSSRQNCLKFISEARANERAAQRQLLSLQLDKQPALTAVSESELRQLAKELGVELRKKKLAPKFISEKEMKKHSEKIYKSLPEVVQKKEDRKKENIKKTNLLMASIFKKNLQKKTLRGAVNLSNYSTVIKI